MEIYLFSLLGILLVILLGISSLQKATPTLSFPETISEYFRVNAIALFSSAIVTFVVINLSVSGELEILQTFSIDVAASKGAGFITGLMSQFILNRVVGLIGSRTPEVVTEHKKVVTI